MEVKFYNSLTRQREVFTPIKEGEVGIYSCGPTVYNYAHIGNFRAYIFSDILNRTLTLAGYKTNLVMNLTDVDDKTIRSSKEASLSLSEYTKKYKDAFFEDLVTLGIKKASVYPAATEHIDDMLDIIKKLKENKNAYEADGSVWFSIESFPEYGKLANLKSEDLKAGASGRVSSDEYEKESVRDFALWKGYTEEDGDVYWESPFGKGRPGWHIECSAMSAKYLGKHFDIHTGGIDNKFPHHENEIAQSTCAFQEKFVNYWLHCDYLIVDGEKMSKSKGNFYTLRALLDKGYAPKTIRYLLLSSHYRKPLNFTLEGLEQAKQSIARINDFVFRLKDINKDGVSNWKEKSESTERSFKETLFDDLNTAGALGVLFEFIKEANSNFNSIVSSDKESILSFLKTVDSVFNFISFEEETDTTEEIERLIEERNRARKEKNFALADDLRDKISAMGIELLDTPNGVKWRKKD